MHQLYKVAWLFSELDFGWADPVEMTEARLCLANLLGSLGGFQCHQLWYLLDCFQGLGMRQALFCSGFPSSFMASSS